jgi:ribosomal-protein-alanine N-acetyltransferase
MRKPSLSNDYQQKNYGSDLGIRAPLRAGSNALLIKFEKTMLGCDMELRSARVVMRLGRPEDVPEILRFYEANRSHLAQWEPVRNPDFYTEDHWTERLDQQHCDFDNGMAYPTFLFATDRPDHVIGCVNFSNFIRGVKQSCTLGYAIDHEAQGKGLMREILPVAFAYVFGSLALHRIEANYMPHNVRSGKLLRHLGFIVEGYARDYIKIAGSWQDHVLTSLVNPADA